MGGGRRKKRKLCERQLRKASGEIERRMNSFQGKTQVSCYTCHRGDEHTVGVPPLPRVAPVVTPRSNEPRPTPQQILAKYTEAIGGKEAVEKIKTRFIKGVSVAANGQSFPLEILFASPDKYSLSVSLPQGATTQKLNGVAGWIKNARRVVTTETPIGIDSEQTDYEDYREVDGVKVAHTIKISYFDNLYSSTRKFTEIKHNAQVDEAQFRMPESK
jgi:hypothetical protein